VIWWGFRREVVKGSDAWQVNKLCPASCEVFSAILEVAKDAGVEINLAHRDNLSMAPRLK
jgi:hypothetical protein